MATKLRSNARAYAEQSLDMEEHLKAYNGLIRQLVDGA
jgi:hypothetical protein